MWRWPILRAWIFIRYSAYHSPDVLLLILETYATQPKLLTHFIHNPYPLTYRQPCFDDTLCPEKKWALKHFATTTANLHCFTNYHHKSHVLIADFQNRPTPFPGWMSSEATKSGLSCSFRFFSLLDRACFCVIFSVYGCMLCLVPYQYQCDWLSGKIRPQSDLLCYVSNGTLNLAQLKLIADFMRDVIARWWTKKMFQRDQY